MSHRFVPFMWQVGDGHYGYCDHGCAGAYAAWLWNSDRVILILFTRCYLVLTVPMSVCFFVKSCTLNFNCQWYDYLKFARYPLSSLVDNSIIVHKKYCLQKVKLKINLKKKMSVMSPIMIQNFWTHRPSVERAMCPAHCRLSEVMMTKKRNIYIYTNCRFSSFYTQ